MKCTIKKLLQAFIYTFTSEFHSSETRDGKNRPPKLAERWGGGGFVEMNWLADGEDKKLQCKLAGCETSVCRAELRRL